MRRTLITMPVTLAILVASAVIVPDAAAASSPAAPTDHSSLVIAWNQTLIAGMAAAATPPPPAARIAAIVQASVFDALNGIDQRYAPYHVRPAAARHSSRSAAVAGAAYTALVALIPAQKALFAEQLATTLSQISADPSHPDRAVENGLSWGTTVANDILTWRAGDGIAAVLPPYQVGTAPGDWQPTPPTFGPPAFRQFATMTPFALTSPAQFLPAGPPALTSPEYENALQMVELRGSATSTARTAFETQSAIFWQDDTPAAMWNRVADQLASANHVDALQQARRLALMNIALVDGIIAIWNAKNTYNFWRPITAVQASGNPTWTPLLVTPLFQEYPSAHSGVSAAASSVLAAFYGNCTRFTVTSRGLPGVDRHFTSFTAAVSQIENARIDAGFHFQFSVVDGATTGYNVASYVLKTEVPRRG